MALVVGGRLSGLTLSWPQSTEGGMVIDISNQAAPHRSQTNKPVTSFPDPYQVGSCLAPASQLALPTQLQGEKGGGCCVWSPEAPATASFSLGGLN